MDEFVIKNVYSNIEDELGQIGFDCSYLKNAVGKFQYKNIKIFDLSIPQANILKQTAISVGADCAVHKETITCKIDKTDCLLGGSYSQLVKISQKLKKQPFKLQSLAALIEQNLSYKLQPINLKGQIFDFSRPYIVGVLNITSNSFSDGGDFLKFDDSVKRLNEMLEEGADIIELGAESTKPFSSAVADEEQLEKLIPMLKYVSKSNIKVPISVDTRSSAVARACIDNGANIINDVSGFDFDKNMPYQISELDVPVIIQHSQGAPDKMQVSPEYKNVMDEIFLALNEKIKFALKCGIKRENIILDPGIGFGKAKEHNFEILKRFEEFTALGLPLMLGISRKSFLGLADEPNEIKDIYTLALNSELIDKKINFMRVHNVKLHKKLLQLKFVK